MPALCARVPSRPAMLARVLASMLLTTEVVVAGILFNSVCNCSVARASCNASTASCSSFFASASCAEMLARAETDVSASERFIVALAAATCRAAAALSCAASAAARAAPASRSNAPDALRGLASAASSVFDAVSLAARNLAAMLCVASSTARLNAVKPCPS